MLPPALRSAHEAVGIAVWLSMFLAAYLATVADGGRRTADGGRPVVDDGWRIADGGAAAHV